MFCPYFVQEEPNPQRVAFLDPNTDPYKSRPVTPLDPKKDIGWAMSASTGGSNGAYDSFQEPRRAWKPLP